MVETDAAEDWVPLAAVEVVALAVIVEEVVSLMPQTASASNVNGMFLARHSTVCRSMESDCCELRRSFRRPRSTDAVGRKESLTGKNFGGAFCAHAAEIRLAILLLIAHACCVIRAGTTRKAAKEASVLVRKRIHQLLGFSLAKY